MIDKIRNLLMARSFVPFTIRLADGREFFIPTRAHAHVRPGGKVISVFTDNTMELGVPASMLTGVMVDDPLAELSV